MAESDRSSPIRPVDDDARALAAKLIDGVTFAALAHLEPESGHPLVTRVGVAAHEGMPIILISQLSAHTTALEIDPRCSLLLGEPGKGDPLAHPRMTLIGRARKVGDPTLRSALRTIYLAKHPKAELYIDFADFAFWQIDPQRAALNGGFGKAYLLSKEDV
jgi:hypothetical protein